MYTVEGQSRALSCDVQTFSPVQPLSLLCPSSVPPLSLLFPPLPSSFLLFPPLGILPRGLHTPPSNVHMLHNEYNHTYSPISPTQD